MLTGLTEDLSSKRKALGAAIDNRSMIDMDQLKAFILEQNKELHDTINKTVQQTIEDNNRTNIQSMEAILDKKLDSFAGCVDTKIESVRTECMSAIQLLSNEVKEKVASGSEGVEDRIDYLERQAKLCDIVIKNVPYRQDEDLKNYIYDLCDAIKFNNTNAIKAAFRMSRNATKSNPIVMKFYDVADKKDFMHAYFECKNLNLTDLGFKTKLRIVISEALTHKNNEIFKKAMQLKFDKVFWSVSTKNGLVHYRLDQKTRPLKITSLSSLNAFYSSGADQSKDNVIQPTASEHNMGESSTKEQQMDPVVNISQPIN